MRIQDYTDRDRGKEPLVCVCDTSLQRGIFRDKRMVYTATENSQQIEILVTSSIGGVIAKG